MNMGRRGFLELTGAAALGQGAFQLGETDLDPHDVEGYGVLLGPDHARPDPNGQYLQQWDTYRFVYFATNTGEKSFISHTDTTWNDLPTPMDLQKYSTPYDALKVANQITQFAIDPSKGLTRRRYNWHSNNVLFDKSFYTENDADGTIDIDTGATANTANIHTSITGQYISQSLAQPGMGLDISASNVSYGADGTVSLSHGSIATGVGWHDNSVGGWGVGSNGGPVQTFLGIRYAADGAYAELISNGSRIGDSPVPQSEWNMDTMDGSGDGDNPSGLQLQPDHGYVYQFPYTWYGHGALYVGVSHPETDDEVLFHKFTVPETSFDRPNMPVTAIVDDEGIATELSVQIGGMQYALYGSSLDTGGGEERGLSITRRDLTATTAASYSNDAVDPVLEPGVPVISFQRKTNVRDIAIRLDNIQSEVNGKLWVFAWDEYEPETALTGANFRDPTESVHPDDETKLQVDTAATDYTPTTAVTRGIDYLSTDKNQASLQQIATDDRLAIDATRVITAVTADTNTDVTLDPTQVRAVEGF